MRTADQALWKKIKCLTGKMGKQFSRIQMSQLLKKGVDSQITQTVVLTLNVIQERQPDFN